MPLRTSDIQKAVQPKVYVGDTLAGLSYNSKLFCDSLTLKLSPDLSTAVLVHKYGKISWPDSPGYVSEAALSLAGKFCAVALPAEEEGGEETILFHGYIAAPEISPIGTFESNAPDLPQGDERYTAYSLDYLLDRQPVTASYLTDTTYISDIAKFNPEDGGKKLKNRSAEAENTYFFSMDKDAELWRAKDIALYLLNRFAQIPLSDEATLEWGVSGFETYFENYTPTLDPAGKSVKKCVDELISPSRGFVYTVEWDASNAKIMLRVLSISDLDIADSDETVVLPKSDKLTSLPDLSKDRLVDNLSIRKMEQSAYGKIRVWSEPLRIMATLNASAFCLEPAWPDADATAYVAASDQDRKKERFQDVYCRFELPADWIQSDHDGNYIIPNLDETTCEYSCSDLFPCLIRRHAFDRELPKLKDDTDPSKGYRRPLLFLKNEKGDYVVSEKESGYLSVGLDLLDNAPGVRLKPHYNHALAKGVTMTSDYAQPYAYADLKLTLSFASDTSLAYQVSGVAGDPKTKNVRLRGYNLWLCAPSTWLDVGSDTGAAWSILKDDRAELKRIANLLRVWYGRVRNSLSYTVRRVRDNDLLGCVITDFYSSSGLTTAGTIVSSLSYDFLNQTCAVSTDFLDVDPAALSERKDAATLQSLADRLAAVESNQKNTPLTQTMGGGGAGSDYLGHYKLTNTSTASAQQVSVVDGLDNSATNCGQVIAGLTTVDVAKATLAISTKTWICLKLTYAASTYTAEIIALAAAPVQAEGTYYRTLGVVTWENSKIKTIQQIIHGDVEVVGRAV